MVTTSQAVWNNWSGQPHFLPWGYLRISFITSMLFFDPGPCPRIRRTFFTIFSNFYFSICVQSHLKHISFSSFTNLFQKLKLSSSEHGMTLRWRFKAFPQKSTDPKTIPYNTLAFTKVLRRELRACMQRRNKREFIACAFRNTVKKLILRKDLTKIKNVCNRENCNIFSVTLVTNDETFWVSRWCISSLRIMQATWRQHNSIKK